MKKKIRLNRSIIKAMTLGLSATIMTSPVTAFADELKDFNDTIKDIDENNDNAISAMKAEAEETREEAKAATESILEVIADIKGEGESTDAEENTGSETDGTGAEENTESETDGAGDEEQADLNTTFEDLSTVESNAKSLLTDIAEVKDAVDNIEKVIINKPDFSENESEDGDEEETDEDAVNAELTSIVQNLVIMSEYEDAIQAGGMALQVIADKAEKIEKDFEDKKVDEQIAAASETADQLEAAPSVSKGEVEDLGNTIGSIEGTVNDAQSAYETETGKYESLSDQIDSFKLKYNNLKVDSIQSANTAEQKLNELADNAETIQKAAETAVALTDIKEKEAVAEKKKNWDNYSDLFKTMVSEYIIPNVLEGSDVKAGTEFRLNTKSDDPELEAEKAQYKDYLYQEDGQWKSDTKSNTFNYYEFSYTDKNNEEQTLKLNYKLEDNGGEKEGLGTGGIVIFEKTEEHVYQYKNSGMYSISDEQWNAVNKGEGVEMVLKDNTANVLFKVDDEIRSYSRDKSNNKIDNPAFTQVFLKVGDKIEEGRVVSINNDNTENKYSYDSETGLSRSVMAEVTVESEDENGSPITTVVNKLIRKVTNLDDRTAAQKISTVYTNNNFYTGNVLFTENVIDGYTTARTGGTVSINADVADTVKANAQTFRDGIEKVDVTKKQDYKNLAESSAQSAQELRSAGKRVSELKTSLGGLGVGVLAGTTKIQEDTKLESKLDVSKTENDLSELKGRKLSLDGKVSQGISITDPDETDTEPDPEPEPEPVPEQPDVQEDNGGDTPSESGNVIPVETSSDTSADAPVAENPAGSAASDTVAPAADTVTPGSGAVAGITGTQSGTANVGGDLISAAASDITTAVNATAADTTSDAPATTSFSTIENGQVAQAAAPSITDTNEIGNEGVAQAAAPAMAGTNADIPAPTGIWALLAILLGATGAEMYRRHWIKKHREGDDK